MISQEAESTSAEVKLTSQNATVSSEETESEVNACSSKTLRYTSPLPMHRWVQLVDPTDCNFNPLSSSYLPYSPWGTLNPYNSPEDQETGYVGVATLPCQIQQRSVKRGFKFTLMVVGESGLGKSTLINSLFLTDVNTDRTLFDAQERIHKTVAITKNTVDIVEKGVKLRLNLVDTPGFGEALDNSNSWKAVVNYIDQQFEQYQRAEMSLNRKNIQDNRVHCCLYFISPYGHGLKPIDVEFMKALHEKVNIVPVLAKADCFTRSEIHAMKTKILDELDTHRIKVYQLPECDIDDDELFKKNDLELKRSIPFAVMGSNTIVERDGRKLRGRLYPWGFVEVENPAHCDFVYLRNMLICTHMQDLKDMTEDTLYERFRTRILCQAKAST